MAVELREEVDVGRLRMSNLGDSGEEAPLERDTIGKSLGKPQGTARQRAVPVVPGVRGWAFSDPSRRVKKGESREPLGCFCEREKISAALFTWGTVTRFRRGN